jgi:hypothetical protein
MNTLVVLTYPLILYALIGDIERGGARYPMFSGTVEPLLLTKILET